MTSQASPQGMDIEIELDIGCDVAIDLYLDLDTSAVRARWCESAALQVVVMPE